MSLINDALKKAQQQREKPSGTSSTPTPATAGAPAASSAAPAGPGGRVFSLLIVGACALIAISVAVTVYLLRGDKAGNRAAIASASPPAAAPSASASTSATAPANPSAERPPAASPSLPTASADKPAGPSVEPALAPANTSPASQTVRPPEPVVPEAPKVLVEPAVKVSYRIQGMIDKFRVAGIRLSPTDSKVILNDHLFRQNDVIEPSLGLRLSKIEAHVLTFTDGDGNQYVKRF